jgi:hypothetical protein
MTECIGVASADFDVGTESVLTPEPPRSCRAANIYQGAFRGQLRAVAIGLLLVNLALGLFARQQQHAVIDHAIDIFDSTFISTNYLHLAQVSFQHYADSRIHAESPTEIAEANELLDNVLTQVDVAIERSTSPRSRELGQEIREKIAGLPSTQSDPQALTDQIRSLQGALEQLSARSTGAALTARDDVESAKSSDQRVQATLQRATLGRTRRHAAGAQHVRRRAAPDRLQCKLCHHVWAAC